MLYSKTCEYAVRALMFLAQKPKGEYVLTREVSRETGVPSPYLAKIFRDLAHHKILLSRRGAAGGVCLAVDPHALSLKKIVTVIDDPSDMKACVMGLDQCSDQNACPLHEVWSEARKKMNDTMKRCTLASITKQVCSARYRKTKRGRLNLDLFLSNSAGD